jgi:hypothetical protein
VDRERSTAEILQTMSQEAEALLRRRTTELLG